jgi:hypothetical protein
VKERREGHKREGEEGKIKTKAKVEMKSYRLEQE